MPNGEEFNPRKLDTPLDKMMRSYAGRRSVTRTERKRGRYIQARPTPGRAEDLAFDATMRAAAPFQTRRTEQRIGHGVEQHVGVGMTEQAVLEGNAHAAHDQRSPRNQRMHVEALADTEREVHQFCPWRY